MSLFEPKYTDLLLEKESREHPWRVTKRDCLLCLILWAVSLAAIPFGALVPDKASLCFVVLFPFIIFCGIKSGFFVQRRESIKLPFADSHGGFETAVFVVTVLCIMLDVGAILLLICYGGSPTETADGYATVNHNVVKRVITESEYRFLCAAEGMSFSAAECIFTGVILIHARREAGLQK